MLVDDWLCLFFTSVHTDPIAPVYTHFLNTNDNI